MIPNFYTYDTFSDYLKDEVLMASAFELGWVDTGDDFDQYQVVDVVGIGQVRLGDAEVRVLDANTSAVKNILPSLWEIPAGTLMNHGSAVRTTSLPVKKEDKTITFTASFATVKGERLKFYNAPKPRQRNEVYSGLIDETLLRLGVSDITSITSLEGKKKLRMYGRRECWKLAMQSLLTDYTYTDTGIETGRREVYEHCKTAFGFEDARLNLIYAEALENAGTSEVRVSTTRQRITARW